MIVGGKSNLIGISGKIGSGKDTLGIVIKNCADSGYEIKKFADKLKDIACLLIGCTRRQLENREFKETPLGEEWDNLTPRKLLQLLGTECGREIIHPNIWVNALFADYVCDNCGQQECPTDEEDTGQMIDSSFPNWIITDVRFPNEAQAIKDRGGIMIRIERPGVESHCGGQHPSETALDNYNFDYVIENEGSIDELIQKIKQLKLV